MEITIETNNFIHSDEDKLKLKSLLQATTDDEFNSALKGILSASFSEYIEMILGKYLANRGEEYRERRLYHLLKNYFASNFPKENEIAVLFQLTETASTTLLRNTRTKFRFDLEQEIVNTIKSILTTANQPSPHSDYEVMISSTNILEELNRAIQTKIVSGTLLKPIKKDKTMIGIYKIPEDTYNVLKEIYEI